MGGTSPRDHSSGLSITRAGSARTVARQLTAASRSAVTGSDCARYPICSARTSPAKASSRNSTLFSKLRLEAAPVEVGRADQARPAVGDHGLGVEQAGRELVQPHARGGEVVVVAAAGRADDLAVVAPRRDRRRRHPAPGAVGQRADQLLVGHEIRRGGDQFLARAHGSARRSTRSSPGRSRLGPVPITCAAIPGSAMRGGSTLSGKEVGDVVAFLGLPVGREHELEVLHRRAFPARHQVDPRPNHAPWA